MRGVDDEIDNMDMSNSDVVVIDRNTIAPTETVAARVAAVNDMHLLASATG